MPVLCMQDMYGAINKMKDPSFIRVESDEVTYPMHILLRYEIEKGLLLGEIEVDDVPKVWNEKMESYLGCAPADDAQARPRISHASLTHLSHRRRRLPPCRTCMRGQSARRDRRSGLYPHRLMLRGRGDARASLRV